MTTQAGLWLNHRKAIIVTITDQGEATRIITSDLEQQVPFRHGGHLGGGPEGPTHQGPPEPIL